MERVEYKADRLNDESRDFVDFLENKLQEARHGLLKLKNAMEVSLYDGMQEMRQLIADTHIHVLMCRMEKIVNEWPQYCKLPNDEKRGLEKQIKMDFKRDLEQRFGEIEDLFSQLRDCFQGLREKLEEEEDTVENRTVFGTFLRFLMRAFVGDWNRNRKDPSWYPRIENSLFDYIQGNMTDDELKHLIEEERFEKDLCHFKEHVQRWISDYHHGLDKIKLPLPVLYKQVLVVDARRTWAYTKALLLGDRNYIKQHNELLSQLIDEALLSGDDVPPFISVARLPRGSKTLKLKLVARETARMQVVNDLVCEFAILAGGNVCHADPSPVAKGTWGYEIKFKEADGVNRFIDIISKKTQKLAEVQVRAALLGEYDIDIGSSRLTNPDFNRIYGKDLSAPGFKPTLFDFLDYSGEKYYCPSGWRRISINVADSAAEFDRRFGGWHVAYHGTKHELAATILRSGFLPAAGAFSDGKNVVYFSPSIEYAGHPRYAKVYEVVNKGLKRYMQMVLQVRINPRSIWKKEGGTLPGAFPPDHGRYDKDRDNPPADPNFPDNQNLEWLVKPMPGKSGIDMFKDMFVIYGIMIRVSDKKLKKNWWK